MEEDYLVPPAASQINHPFYPQKPAPSSHPLSPTTTDYERPVAAHVLAPPKAALDKAVSFVSFYLSQRSLISPDFEGWQHWIRYTLSKVGASHEGAYRGRAVSNPQSASRLVRQSAWHYNFKLALESSMKLAD